MLPTRPDPLLRAAEEGPCPARVQNSRLTPPPETLANAAAVPCSVSMVPSPDTEGLGLPPGHLPARPFTTGLKQTVCRDAHGRSPPPAFPRVQRAVRTQLSRTGGVGTHGLSHSASRLGHSWVFAGLWFGLTPPLSGTSATPVLQGPARSPWVTTPRSLCPCISPSTLLPAAPLPVLPLSGPPGAARLGRRSPQHCWDTGRIAESSSPPRDPREPRVGAHFGPTRPYHTRETAAGQSQLHVHMHTHAYI